MATSIVVNKLHIGLFVKSTHPQYLQPHWFSKYVYSWGCHHMPLCWFPWLDYLQCAFVWALLWLSIAIESTIFLQIKSRFDEICNSLLLKHQRTSLSCVCVCAYARAHKMVFSYALIILDKWFIQIYLNHQCFSRQQALYSSTGMSIAD